MSCAIDDGECLGGVDLCETLTAPLCQFHFRTLCELGESAFREWYSIELEDAALAIEARRAIDSEAGVVGDESAGPKDNAQERNPE